MMTGQQTPGSPPAVLPLSGVPKAYPWGCAKTLPRMLGLPTEGQLVAEWWLGAHAQGPGLVHAGGGSGIRLDAFLAANPATLGGHEELPFLLKLLSAKRSLSLQVHPNRAQAAAGFAREDEAGIKRADGRRNYLDTNHKPELIVALTPFRALAGIRPPMETLEICEEIGSTPLIRAMRPLRARPDAHGVREALDNILRRSSWERHHLVCSIVEAVERRPGRRKGGQTWRQLRDANPLTRALDLIALLAKQHPGDVGLVAALLCNDVILAPGEALFQPAGLLHAYVAGTGVEIMAASDNVLRCGLTTKHIDVDELLSILDSTPRRAQILTRAPGDAEWPVPVQDFRLAHYDPRRKFGVMAPTGPSIVLALESAVHLTTPDSTTLLRPGRAAFVAAGTPVRFDRGEGAWVADCPLPTGSAVGRPLAALAAGAH
jgi:mannose-6-phosphate isomerase